MCLLSFSIAPIIVQVGTAKGRPQPATVNLPLPRKAIPLNIARQTSFTGGRRTPPRSRGGPTPKKPITPTKKDTTTPSDPSKDTPASPSQDVPAAASNGTPAADSQNTPPVSQDTQPAPGQDTATAAAEGNSATVSEGSQVHSDYACLLACFSCCEEMLGLFKHS